MGNISHHKRGTRAKELRTLVEHGTSNARAVPTSPVFEVDSGVRGRTLPGGHVQIPGYAQGATGTVDVVHGAFVFPDTNLRGEGENPDYVYAVRIGARDLWPDSDEHASVVGELPRTRLMIEGGAVTETSQQTSAHAALRARAIESLLIEKGYLTEEAVDYVVSAYERDIGPLVRRSARRTSLGRAGLQGTPAGERVRRARDRRLRG